MKGARHCAGVIKAILNGKGCAMGLSKRTISVYEKYAEIIDELEALGCNRDDAYTYLPVTGVVNTRVLGQPNLKVLKRSSPIRKKIMDYLFNCVISKTYATPRGIRSAGGADTTTWSKEDFQTHYRDELFQGMAGNWFERTKGLKRRAQALSHYGPISGDSAELTNKIAEITRILNPPQIQILRRGMEVDGLDNEYAALIIALKKYAEYLDGIQGAS